MAVFRTYIDDKDDLLKMKEAIPQLIEDLKDGKVDPGIDRLFEEAIGGSGYYVNFSTPCCTLGHLLHRADLAKRVSPADNGRTPDILFVDTEIKNAVMEVYASNDHGVRREFGPQRNADIIHNLKNLQSVLTRELERL